MGVEGAEDEGRRPLVSFVGWAPGEPGCIGSEEAGVESSFVAGRFGAAIVTGAKGLFAIVNRIGDGAIPSGGNVTLGGTCVAGELGPPAG